MQNRNLVDDSIIDEVMNIEGERASRRPRDPQLLEAIRNTREEIARAFGDKRTLVASLTRT